MKAILFALLPAALLAQDMKIRTEHQLIPAVTSPFTVQLEGAEFDHVHFWLENARSKKEDGSSCTFEASPGIAVIRAYGLVWDAGVLKPKVKKESRILIVEPSSTVAMAPKAWQDPPPEQFSVIAKTPPPAPTEAEPKAKPKKLDGWRIEMKTNSDIACPPCERWKNEEWPNYIAEGAEVTLVEIPGAKPVPQFRVIHDGKATKWSVGYMSPEKFEKHYEILK